MWPCRKSATGRKCRQHARPIWRHSRRSGRGRNCIESVERPPPCSRIPPHKGEGRMEPLARRERFLRLPPPCGEGSRVGVLVGAISAGSENESQTRHVAHRVVERRSGGTER